MRYLYRSYCLKEGQGQFKGSQMDELIVWEQKGSQEIFGYAMGKKNVGGMDEGTMERFWCQGWESIKLGGGRDYMDGPIYHWGIYTYWLKSTTRRALKVGPPISWWRAERPPLLRASARATGRWVSWGWPACRTSGAAPSLSCWGPQRPCRWHRSCRSCHSPEQL